MFLAILLCSAAAIQQGDAVTLRDGTSIHYVERRPQEPKSDLALVFLPGWMMPGSVWKHQLDGFGSKFRVIALDPRCQGDSTKTPDGNYPAQRADDLRQVIERRNVQRFVLVAATSSVVDAVAYAERFGTDRLEGLVLVHGVAGTDYTAESLIGLLGWAQRFQTNRVPQTESLVRSLFSKDPPQDEVRRLTTEALKMPTSCAMAAFVGSLTTDLRPSLPKLDIPTLLIVGESRWHDQYEAMRKAIPGARLVKIEGTAHAPYLELPSAFNATLGEFVETLAGVNR